MQRYMNVWASFCLYMHKLFIYFVYFQSFKYFFPCVCNCLVVTVGAGLEPSSAPTYNAGYISCYYGNSYTVPYESQFYGSFAGSEAFVCYQICGNGYPLWGYVVATYDFAANGYYQVYTCSTSNCNRNVQTCAMPTMSPSSASTIEPSSKPTLTPTAPIPQPTINYYSYVGSYYVSAGLALLCIVLSYSRSY